jgi:hypothetical protein
LAWLGLAWLGLAWLGLAWLGLAWLGSSDHVVVPVIASSVSTHPPPVSNRGVRIMHDDENLILPAAKRVPWNTVGKGSRHSQRIRN